MISASHLQGLAIDTEDERPIAELVANRRGARPAATSGIERTANVSTALVNPVRKAR
jgi:hypothetical protein